MVLFMALPSPTLAPPASPLARCPWDKLAPDPESEAREDLAEWVEALRRSPLFHPPGEGRAAQALRERLDRRPVESPYELAKSMDAFMKLRGWTPELRAWMLGLPTRRAVDILTRHNGLLVPQLDRGNEKHGPALAAFLTEAFRDSDRVFQTGAYNLAFDMIALLDLPVADIAVVDLGNGQRGYDHLNRGTGASSFVYRGKFRDKSVAIKMQQSAREDRLAVLDHEVLKSLASYGGPKSYGLVRVKDELGRWRQATAIEIVEGKDLLTLRREREAGRPPSLPLTQRHVAAFRALVERIEREHTQLVDVQPGDFMFTPDGRVVPLDMEAIPVPRNPGEAPTREVRLTLSLLREHLATVESLATPY
jgi:hypothetical protein